MLDGLVFLGVSFAVRIISVHVGICSSGGGALLYNRGYGCTSGTFNPYSLQTKIPAKSWTNDEKFSEICTPKRRKMNFCNVAAYFCSIENISQNLCYFIYLIRKIMILRKFETLIAWKLHPFEAKKTSFADFMAKIRTLICRTSILRAIWKCPPPPPPRVFVWL